MSKEIAALLPYGQAAATIEEAADSVLAQQDASLVLVAIDDGSTDDGPARLKRLAAHHASLVHLSSGRGTRTGVLAGLAAANTPYVARVGADDASLPGRLARELEALRSDGRLAAVASRVEVFPAGAACPGLVRHVAWPNALVTAEDHAREIVVESLPCHSSVLLRRTALLDVGASRETGDPEDDDPRLRLDAGGWGLATVFEVQPR